MFYRLLGFFLFASVALTSAFGQGAALSSAPAWQAIGPQQIVSPSYGVMSGRIGALALDPADSTGNTLYVGGLGGGVWKSMNAASNAASAAASFVPLTDSVAVPSLAIGAISADNGVVLAGTGDGNGAMDSHYGAGILRSGDGGKSWQLVTGTQDGFNGGRANFSFMGEAFNGFAWSSVTPGLVVAAVGGSANTTNVVRNGLSVRGLFYSVDAGATWSMGTVVDGSGAVVQSNQTDFSAYQGNDVTAVVWNPVRRRFYAAVRYHGFYDSPDGITWTRLAVQPGTGLSTLFCPTNPGVPASVQCPIFRGALAVDAASGDTFALSVDARDVNQGLWRDICGRTNGNCAAPLAFSAQLDTSALDTDAASGTISGGDYALSLAAHDGLLFAGTEDLFRCSLSGGCVWRNTTNALGCAAAKVAPAQHAIVSAGNMMFFATDGGVWRSDDAVAQTGPVCGADDAAHFVNLNGGLGSLAEISSFAQDPVSGAVLAAAGRDGVVATGSATAAGWTQISPSAFSPVAIDQGGAGDWYAETGAGVNIGLCPEGVACLQTGFAGPVIGAAQVAGDEAGLNAPFLLDPAKQAQVLVGTCRVWRGAADGSGWPGTNALSTMLDGTPEPSCNGNTVIRSLAAGGPATAAGSKVIYAGMAAGGSVGGHVFANFAADQASAATVWTDLTLSPVVNGVQATGPFNVGGFDVSSVTADAHDATGKTVYATIAGFSGNGINAPLVYRSGDGGATWQNITSNLPDVPANALLVDALDANTVYVALDTGVFVTNIVASFASAGANCWNAYLTGLPSLPVTSLSQVVTAGQAVLRAGTLGRGIWQAGAIAVGNPGKLAVSPPSLNFGQQAVGTTSPAQTVTVTNSGGAPVKAIVVNVSANFNASSACVPPLPAGKSCSVAVTFSPLAAGPITGTLSVSDGVAAQTVNLSGAGVVVASMTVTPASLSFPATGVGAVSAAQAVTVTNTGGSTLTGFSATVGSDFQIANGGTCTATIPAGVSCTVQVAFAPTAAGSRIGALEVAADGVQPQSVTLTGTGVDFAISVVGAASATVKAGGTASFKLAITPAAGSLGFANLACSGLPAHTACLMDPSPSSLTAPSTVTLSVGTSAKAAAVRGGSVLWGFLVVPFLLPLAKRRRVVLACALLVIAGVTGCGAGTATLVGSPAGGTTPPGSYSFTVTGTSAGISRSVGLTLVVK